MIWVENVFLCLMSLATNGTLRIKLPTIKYSAHAVCPLLKMKSRAFLKSVASVAITDSDMWRACPYSLEASCTEHPTTIAAHDSHYGGIQQTDFCKADSTVCGLTTCLQFRVCCQE